MSVTTQHVNLRGHQLQVRAYLAESGNAVAAFSTGPCSCDAVIQSQEPAQLVSALLDAAEQIVRAAPLDVEDCDVIRHAALGVLDAVSSKPGVSAQLAAQLVSDPDARAAVLNALGSVDVPVYDDHDDELEAVAAKALDSLAQRIHDGDGAA